MKYTVEIDSILDFPAWQGGLVVQSALKKCESLVSELDMEFDSENQSETEINDYLWFYLEDDLLNGEFSSDAVSEAISVGLIKKEDAIKNGVL